MAFRSVLVAAFGIVTFPATVSAADLQLRVGVDTREVRVGSSLNLSLSVARSGRGGGEVPVPELPAVVEAGFEVASCMPGVRTNIDMFRGERQQTRTLDCVLIAETPGEYSFGFAVDDEGRRMHSNVVEVRVLAQGAASEAATSSEGLAGDALQELKRRGVAVVAAVDKSTAFVGEQITYTLDLYEARNFLDPHFRSPPTFKDFLTQELPVEEARVESTASLRYRVRPAIRRALFPQRAGTLEIGSADIAIGMRGQVRAAPITIEVAPLPAEGQPPGFSPNNVGRYELRRAVDREALTVGEPFTYTVTIAGKGNIEIVDPGKWPVIEGVRRYDPKVETKLDGEVMVGGERRYSFLMIPERAGALTIPAHHVDYFDPAEQRYGRATAEPLTLEVGHAEGTPEPSVAASAKPDSNASSEAWAPIVAAEAVPRRQPEPPWLTARRWAYGMVAIPILAVLGLSVGSAWRRFGPDELARARAAARRRRQGWLRTAEESVTTGEGFHAAVAQLLHAMAVERAGAEGTGLPRPSLLALLERRGVPAADLRELERLLDACDAARFGAARGSAEDRRTLLDDALALARGSGFGRGGVA